MAAPVSAGHILMLSQVAWRLTCAFTAGRASAPSQFQEVENELKGLTHSLTMLAESLDQDGSLLAKADGKTREGMVSILSCCSQSLDDLDTFVNSYQDIRRVDQPGGGRAVQRSWRSFFLRNYKTIIWTTEGGNIQSLRNMLAMHTQSITIAMEALQTRSLSRLERIIEPVAEKVGDIHNRLNGDLDLKLEEIHDALLSIKADTASASAAATPVPFWPQRDSSLFTNSPVSPTRTSNSSQPPIPPRSDRRLPSGSSFQDPMTPQKTPDLSDSEFHSSPVEPYRGSQISNSSSVRYDRLSDMPLPDQFYQLPGSLPERNPSRRKIGSISHDLERLELASKGNASPIRELRENSFGTSTSLSPHASVSVSARSPVGSSQDDPFSGSPGILPPPSLPIPSPKVPATDDPFHKIRMLGRTGSKDPSAKLDISETAQQRAAWERLLFTNSAILCDTRGITVEYTQPDENRPGDFIMEKACEACRICLVTKPQKLASGNIRYSSSIWTLSDDSVVRLEQRIPDDDDVVPYTVWDNHTKIVLRLKTELQYHDTSPDSRLPRRAETAWVNYIFADEPTATVFQNALMNKTLLLSVRTRRTMRLFQGVSGAFAFAEQLCGLENLRIFFDAHTNIAYGMIHYIPDFSQGYMMIPLNDVRNPIRIREENHTTVRIKGLKIPLKEKVTRRPSTSDDNSKAKQEKFLTGAKIEFYARKDKEVFMAKVKDIQDSYMGSE